MKLKLREITIIIVSLCNICFASIPIDRTQLVSLIQQKILQQIKPNQNERIEIIVGQIDPRLNLNACQNLPMVRLSEFKHTTQMITATLSCYEPKPWKIYLPVTVKIFTSVVVANENIGKGMSLNSHNIKLEERDRQQLLSGYYSDPDQLFSFTAKRNIRMGAVISPNVLNAPILIRRGEPVILFIESPGLKISMQGVAKEDGALNEVINVMNLKSKKIVNGYVVGQGRVRVP